MLNNIKKDKSSPFEITRNPYEEMLAYEYLWANNFKISYKKIADSFREFPNRKISDLIDEKSLKEFKNEFLKVYQKYDLNKLPKVIIKGTSNYPKTLLDAKYPIEFLYYEGDLSLLNNDKLISVVGSRKPTEEGIRRTKKLVKGLVANGFTIVSGLAEGIDTVAHRTAIEEGGETIAVIGTPIDEYYPKSNKELQMLLMKDYLVLSQVPYVRYNYQNPKVNRFFFPERNKTMSALSMGTIIVEASERSGTLIQARAAIEQKRKLFILKSCFEKDNITWPKKYLNKGAKKVVVLEDIIKEFIYG